MTDKNHIIHLVNEAIAGTEIFLVHVSVGGNNRIMVEVDSTNGVTISDCVKISRQIESQLDREKEDFELNVSSPGLENPFRVPQQYAKNIGRSVVVDLLNGTQVKGVLKNFGNEKVELETKIKEKTGNKKEVITKNHLYNLNEIKQTRVVVSFK
ncbi:MAG: ribosome assembly cofactor RimP [Bacteroidota bacterium]